MGGPTSEQRGAELVQDLRAMIAVSYVSGDREMAGEKRHAAAAFRVAVNDALERAAALIEQSPPDSAALAAAVRGLKEAPPAPPAQPPAS